MGQNRSVLARPSDDRKHRDGQGLALRCMNVDEDVWQFEQADEIAVKVK